MVKAAFLAAGYQSREERAREELESLERELLGQAAELLPGCELGVWHLSPGSGAEEIAALRDKGCGRVFIQPTLLFDGAGMERLRAVAREFGPLVVLGRPLLAGEKELEGLIASLGLSRGCPALLLAHGGEGAMALLQRLSALLREGGYPAFVGALKGTPGWAEALDWAKQHGVGREMELIPLLLTAGVHFRRDVEREWGEKLEAVGVAVRIRKEGLAGLEGIREMYRERVRELVCGPDGGCLSDGDNLNNAL